MIIEPVEKNLDEYEQMHHFNQLKTINKAKTAGRVHVNVLHSRQKLQGQVGWNYLADNITHV